MAFCTFDPASVVGGALSNSDLKFTQSGGQGSGAFSTYGQSSGKYYFEFKFNNTNDNSGFGLTNQVTTSWFGNATGNYLGGDGGGLGFYAQFGSGSIYTSNAQAVSGIGSNSNTADYCFAVDCDNGSFWCRKDGGNWNNNGSANPATNTGGVTLPPGLVYLVVGCRNSGEWVDLNLGQSAFAQSVPSGFTSGWPVPATTRDSNFWDPVYPSQTSSTVGFYSLALLTLPAVGLLSARMVLRGGTSGSGEKMRIVVVADNAGVPLNPDVPLFSSNTLTSPALGQNTFTFANANISAGNYWIGYAYSAASGGRGGWKNGQRSTVAYHGCTDAASLPNSPPPREVHVG